MTILHGRIVERIDRKFVESVEKVEGTALLSRFTFICKFNRSLPELMIIRDCNIALDSRVKCCELEAQGSPIAEIIGNLSAAPDSLAHFEAGK